MASLHALRTQVRQLLDDSSFEDAPTAYYALFHDPARSSLVTHVNEKGVVTGFVGVFQTGIDLFRPLVTLLCRDEESAVTLLQRALTPGRPYIFFAKLSQLPLVSRALQFDGHRVLDIMRLDPRRFKPVVNVLAHQTTAHDGTPRCVIESRGGQAVAGINWQSPAFAEIFVQTDPALRGRGLGTSVASGVTQAVLASGRLPLYLVEHDHGASRHIAEELGYIDTGARQVIADVVYAPS